jgi:hypothetical protein
MSKSSYNPNNPHIRTFRDRKFHFFDFGPEDIDIEEIAHSLSNLCRYGGHCKQFYCPTIDQRILTKDLLWIPAGDLAVGNKLVGFDEYPIIPGSTGNRRRRFRPSTITHTQMVKRRVFRIETEDGRTVCASVEHPWLIATKQSRNQIWCTSNKISKAVSEGRNRYMHVFIDPWQTIDNRDAGWLAGMFDGEGYLSIYNRRGIQCGVSQKPGLTSDRLQALLTQFGFDYNTNPTGTSTYTHCVRGGFRSILRLLGSIRPHRLLDIFTTALSNGEFTKQLDGKGIPKKIVKVYDEGNQWVMGIETDIHTYLCEGFGAHNSVAQHSIQCCRRSSNKSIKMWCLLHDAAEAYIGDITGPLKSLLVIRNPGYNNDLYNGQYMTISEYEKRILKVIATKFKLPWPIPKEVFDIDREYLYEEMAILWDNESTGVELEIFMSPKEAEQKFLKLFEMLNTRKEVP